MNGDPKWSGDSREFVVLDGAIFKATSIDVKIEEMHEAFTQLIKVKYFIQSEAMAL